MKKILTFSPSKVLLLCGLGMLMTLGAFWHHQVNQFQLDRMNILNQGAATCWGRISQTFTAMMIKDFKSPYLDRGFMALSDECLNETIKSINPFKRDVGKGHETLNKLISEVHWFHEKVNKIATPMQAGHNLNTPLTPLSDRYGKMENYKVSMIDEIDASNARIRSVQGNDEVLMGLGLLIFTIGLSILSLQEFNRIQLRREIEKDALNLLKAGQTNVGALVDTLVDRALTSQGMVVTSQIFRDYHGDLLELLASKYVPQKKVEEKVEERPEVKRHLEKIVVAGPEVEDYSVPMLRTSLKEVLVSLQNVHGQDNIHTSEVRDVQLAVDYESCEQMMNAALNKLAEKRINSTKKIMISNQVHSDRSIINFFLGGNTFTAGELEFAGGRVIPAETSDMNMIILKEMVDSTGASFFIENKADRNGSITGMSIRLTLKRTAKEKTKLVSVVKGKKKDLSREMMN